MTLKTATTWNPQPLGFGYVTQVTAASLKTETSATLKTETSAVLMTGTQSITGKFPTTWTDTGA